MLTPRARDLDLSRPLAEFAERGYARLGQVLTTEGACRLTTRAAALMQGEVRYPHMFFQHDSPSGRYEDLVFNEGWVGASRRAIQSCLMAGACGNPGLTPLDSRWRPKGAFWIGNTP